MDETPEKSKVGMSVCIEEVDGEQSRIAIVIHTADEEKNFMIALSHEQAMTMSKDLYQAVKIAERTGDPNPDLN